MFAQLAVLVLVWSRKENVGHDYGSASASPSGSDSDSDSDSDYDCRCCCYTLLAVV